MHALLINQFFYPDFSATAQLATDLAEDLVSLGIEVTVVASRGGYLGGVKQPRQEEHRGVKIVRVAATSFGKSSIVSRLSDYGAFYAAASFRTLRLARPDVVIVMSTPPLVGSIGAAVRAIRGPRFVYWAQDIYPDLAVEMNVLGRRSPATRLLGGIASMTIRRADAVVTLGNRMGERLVAHGADRARIHIIPNWADPDAIRPVQPGVNPFRGANGLEGQRVVLYSGNMGRGHDIETILSVAEMLKERRDITFLFIGDGAKRKMVEVAASTNSAIRVLPYQPRGMLSESLSAGDVHLVSQDANTEGLMEPSKLYGIMAAGRPVLYIGPAGTEVSSTITGEAIGKSVSNGDASGARDAIIDLLEDGVSAGVRARRALEERYGRKARTSQFATMLRNVCPSARGIPPADSRA